MELSLNYDHTFAEKHAVSAMLMFNRRNYDDGSKLPYRNQGFAGRTSYTYSGKYVAEFNFGYNGSENFALVNDTVFLLELLDGLFLKRILCNLQERLFLS